MRNRDKFWLNNPKILLDSRRISEFYPSDKMSSVEQLNAVVRFSLYLSLLLILLKLNVNYIFIFLFSLLATYIIYNFDDNMKKQEDIEHYEVFKDKSILSKNKVYVKPTYDNPFMNPSLCDYKNNPNREAYSKKSFIYNEKIKEEIEDKFSYNLYQDVNDIYGKNNSQRQFYTTPVTTIPNDQDSFAKWLYSKGEHCKDGDGYQCMQNNPRFLQSESRDVIY
jgi:hypothetical protein